MSFYVFCSLPECTLHRLIDFYTKPFCHLLICLFLIIPSKSRRGASRCSALPYILIIPLYSLTAILSTFKVLMKLLFLIQALSFLHQLQVSINIHLVFAHSMILVLIVLDPKINLQLRAIMYLAIVKNRFLPLYLSLNWYKNNWSRIQS